MTLAHEIAPYLPFLRRFARALTGNQRSGDQYVATLLEALIADQSAFPDLSDKRVSLYKALVDIWSSVETNVQFISDDTISPSAEKNLQNISPMPRQAFLLSTIEGFTADEVGQILGVSSDEVGALLEAAAKEIGEQVATSVLIIEDEPLIAMDVEAMVEDLGHQVTGIARTHGEAIKLFEKQHPGIVLADIQLADGSSGLDAVNEILESVDVPVIFITAFPERLLTGNRPEPTFLVTKPFQPQMVAALISQALFFNTRPQQEA